MLDRLQQAVQKGGLQGLASELGRVSNATRAAAQASAQLNAVMLSNAGVRGRVVELARTQTLMRAQNQLLRDRIGLEAREKAVASGDYARATAAQRAVELQRQQVGRMEETVQLQDRLRDAQGGTFGREDAAGRAMEYDRRTVGRAEQAAALKNRLGDVQSGRYGADDAAERALMHEKERVAQFEQMARLQNRMKDAQTGQYALTEGERQATAFQEKRVALAERESLVREGTFATNVKQMARLQSELRKVEEMEKRAAYEARLGRRLGGAVYAVDAASRSAVGQLAGAGVMTAGAVAGAGFGMGMAGFGGTVEQLRFQTEMQMLQRELAGTLKPGMDLATLAAGATRRRMEQLDRPEQTGLGLALGGAGAATIAEVAARKLTGSGIFGWLQRGAGFLARGGGPASMLGGGNFSQVPNLPPGGAPQAGGFLSNAGRALGGVARVAGPVAAFANAAKVAYESIADPLSDPVARVGGLFSLRGAGRTAARALDVPFHGETARMFGLNSGSLFGQTYDFTFGANDGTGDRGVASKLFRPPEQPRNAAMSRVTDAVQAAVQNTPAQPDPARRRVTPADAGFEEMGAGFFRITTALNLRDAGYGEGEGTQTSDAILKDIRDDLRALAERYGLAPRSEP